MNRIINFINIFILVILIQGCFLLPKEKKLMDEDILPPVDNIQYLEVFKGPIEEKIKTYSIARPIQERNLYFTVEGVIGEILKKYGDRVKKGETLMILNRDDVEHEMVKQKRMLEKADIFLSEIKDEFDKGKRSQYDLRLAQIDLEIEKTNYDYLKKKYEDAIIHSPFNGIVTYIKSRPGDFIKAYEEVLRVSNPDILGLTIYVSPDDFINIKDGLTVKFEYNNQWIKGRLYNVPNFGDKLPNGEQDYKCLVRPDNNNIEFKYNEVYSSYIIVKSKKEALQLDNNGIREYLGNKIARVKDKRTGVISERYLILGIKGEGTTEILKGLNEGDKVISK